LLMAADEASLRGRRDYAMLARLRRAELTALRIEDLQLREEHWVIADLVGKGGHMRTIPVPDWVKAGVSIIGLQLLASLLVPFYVQSTRPGESGEMASARR
jgi:site-specific recombinase XerC